MRSTKDAIDEILDGMNWLGLDWDGHEYYQSQFWARHADIARRLVERGAAYRCWMTQEELAAQREKAAAERRPFRIASPWRDCAPDAPTPDDPFVIRLKASREGETVIEDKVQGRVTVQNAEIDDFVLLRSDGTPTYMLAVVVDDHDMGVTYVIRGDDHLNNAFRQLGIIRAMEWPEPVYAHVPLIHGPDGAKLSKRHGALGVDAYRDELGMLPEAVFNIPAARLGPRRRRDHFTRASDRMVRPRSRREIAVSLRFQEAGESERPLHPRDGRSAARRPGCGEVRHFGREKALLARAMPELKARAHTLNELADGAGFLFAKRPLEIDEAAAALYVEARPLLIAAHDNGALSQSGSRPSLRPSSARSRRATE